MVIKAPYTRERYDYFLKQLVDQFKEHIEKKNDDALIVFCGETGSGKSNLCLHIFEQYLGEKANMDYVGMDKESISLGLKSAKDQPFPRCFWADEANISKRDSLTKWNKDLLDLYLAIRGLQILHLWCNPSVDMLDKAFVEERIKGVVFVLKRGVMNGTVRFYYYFKKKDLLKILLKYGNLKLNLLYKVRKKYAYYRGWFREYDGVLMKEYLSKKDSRMDEKIEEFAQRWGKVKQTDLLKQKDVAKHLGVVGTTVSRYANKLKEEGVLEKGVNYFVYPSGKVVYKNTLLDDFERLCRKASKRRNTLEKNRNKKKN